MNRFRHAWYDPRRWPSLVVFVVALVAVVFLSGVIASIGIRLAGSLAAWRTTMDTAAPLLMGWRLVFYGVITWLWLRYWKPRVLARIGGDRDGGVRARHKLNRIELVSIGFIVVLELMNVANWLGGM
ncbi:hypothetical protein [Billgrantia montanilacus]|uniref:Copper resistance protein D domain-containing protein n=1 Tax=Billgrantia montanilacus TaxID=2282305 RepID=A0A368TQN2_9GAMM|nr:hypothetical protein [Halomonas montanilacus]RCV86918.1 hypothetical protein DU505_19005 [Halomonas montanilacus]